MVQVKNNVVSINKSRKMSRRQIAILNNLDQTDRQRYLMSLMGMKARMHVDRNQDKSEDILANKDNNFWLTQLNRMKDVTRDHRPTRKSIGQWVGVEIECYIPHQDSDGYEDCTCNYDGDDFPEHSDDCNAGSPYWSRDAAHDWLRGILKENGVIRCTVKEDGSLEDDEGHGVEICIVFNTEYGFEPLEKLCKALNHANVYVNKTCGMHIHLDARHLIEKQVKRIGKSIGNTLPVLKYLVDDSRHDNYYCKLKVGPLSDNNSARYYAVNLNAYYKFKTIEIRLHGGTTNFKKIKNWIDLIRLIAQSDIKKSLNSFQDLIDATSMPDSLVEYAEKRINTLNPVFWSQYSNLVAA